MCGCVLEGVLIAKGGEKAAAFCQVLPLSPYEMQQAMIISGFDQVRDAFPV